MFKIAEIAVLDVANDFLDKRQELSESGNLRSVDRKLEQCLNALSDVAEDMKSSKSERVISNMKTSITPVRMEYGIPPTLPGAAGWSLHTYPTSSMIFLHLILITT